MNSARPPPSLTCAHEQNFSVLARRESPLPDELLCSYLYRSAILNGFDSFRILARRLLTDCRIDPFPAMTNLFAPTAVPSRILAAIGWRPEAAMARLTTWPYWQTFGAKSCLALASSPTSWGWKPLRTNTLRWCPACVDEDRERYGLTYFRRAHQLPLMRYCSFHQRELLHACRGCGRHFGASGEPEPLPFFCRCGFALGDSPTSPSFITHGDAWLRLGEISVQALTHAGLSFDAEVLSRRVRQIVRDRYNKSPIALLTDTYGATGARWILKDWRAPAPLEQSPSVRRQRFELVQAPQLCALMAVVDGDLDNTVRQYRHPAKQMSSRTSSKEDRRLVNELAQTLLPGASLQRLLQRDHHDLYQRMRRNDWQWFEDHFPARPGQYRRGPREHPVLDDRRKLLAKLAEMQEFDRWELVNNAAARRALVRDRAWLQDLIEERRKTDQARSDAMHVAAVESARFDLLSQPGEPQPVTLQAIAARLGWSRAKLYQFSVRNPQIRPMIRESIDELETRRVAWAVPLALASGVAPFPCNIARWMRTNRVRRVLTKIRAELDRLHLCGSSDAPESYGPGEPILTAHTRLEPTRRWRSGLRWRGKFVATGSDAGSSNPNSL